VCAAGVPDGGQAELTAAMVCSECAPTAAGGTATLLSEGEAAEGWWSVRQEEAAASRQRQFAITVDGVVVWKQIRCRYGCANGSTSSNESPEAYRRQPCIPCATALMQMDPALACAEEGGKNVSAFLDAPEGQPPCGTPGPGETTNFRPFKAVCVSCEARLQQWDDDDNDAAAAGGTGKVPRYVFPLSMPKPATKAELCLALCNPSLYHSYDRLNKVDVPITALVPFGRLRCGACADQTRYRCLDGCAEGYYLNASLGICLACTATPCPANAGLYRERCPRGSATRDAQCVPYPSEALQNSGDETTTVEQRPPAAPRHQGGRRRVHVQPPLAHGRGARGRAARAHRPCGGQPPSRAVRARVHQQLRMVNAPLLLFYYYYYHCSA
jgi:hypothetical protein